MKIRLTSISAIWCHRHKVILCLLFWTQVSDGCQKAAKSSQGSSSATRIFDHPGMLHTTQDFSRMIDKVNAGAQPQLSGWNKLLANPHSSSDYKMKGAVDTVYRGVGSAENYVLLPLTLIRR